MAQPTQFVAGNIRAEMARAGVTQKTLAAALGKTQQTVSYKLRGNGTLTVDELHQIADVLGLPVERLIREPKTAEAAS